MWRDRHGYRIRVTVDSYVVERPEPNYPPQTTGAPAQPLARPNAAQPVAASKPTSASESAKDIEAVAMFDPTALERRAERDQERRVWEQVDKAP